MTDLCILSLTWPSLSKISTYFPIFGQYGQNGPKIISDVIFDLRSLMIHIKNTLDDGFSTFGLATVRVRARDAPKIRILSDVKTCETKVVLNDKS